MSDTPRTDADEFFIPDDSLIVGRRVGVVYASKARELERELAAMMGETEKNQVAWQKTVEDDNAQFRILGEQLKSVSDELAAAREELEKVTKERDEFIEYARVTRNSLSRAQQDAERWRHIRKSATAHHSDYDRDAKWRWSISVVYDADPDMSIDAAIDAARGAESGEKP